MTRCPERLSRKTTSATVEELSAEVTGVSTTAASAMPHCTTMCISASRTALCGALPLPDIGRLSK